MSGTELVDEGPANWGLGFGDLCSSAPSLALFNDNLIAAPLADWLEEAFFS